MRRLLLVLVLALTPALRAQADLPKKEITEKTSGSLAQLKTFIDAKDYPKGLLLIDSLLAKAEPTSFDTYVLAQIKAQILLTQGKLTDAIVPLETSLRLGQNNPNFYDAAAELEQMNLLAQLHYQKAAELKDPAAQKAGYLTALDLMSRWLAKTPKPTADSRLFAASLTYQLGSLDPAKPDEPRLREAIGHAREGLLLSIKPTNQLVLLLVACHLQLGENPLAAEQLEALALRDPKSAVTWSQLQSLYLAAAADTQDPEESRRQNLRALLVLDRAQALGFLNTPKDHYTRVAILFNIQQYTRAAALLEKGLVDGSIENQKRNWELLTSAYQQTSQDEKALDAMLRASSRFPQDAALEFSLAQFLYNTGQLADAYARAEAALAKGLDKPGQAHVYLAYLAYELQRYDDAKGWVEKARASGEVPAATLDPLANAIAEAIRARA